MNEQKIKSEWKKFEDGFGAYMFDVRKMGETIQWVSDTPEMMSALLLKGTKEAKADLDKCLSAIDSIIEEL